MRALSLVFCHWKGEVEGDLRFGYAFNMDTGTSTGEIGGHSKTINAVSIRNQRPFRAATAADDNTIVFHQGRSYLEALLFF